MRYCIKNKDKFYNVRKREFILEINDDCIIPNKRIATYVFNSLQSSKNIDLELNVFTDDELENMGLDTKIFKKPSYSLGIEYESYKPSTYKGIFINRRVDDDFRQIILVNTGDVKVDEELALEQLYNIAGEVKVSYLSSYDDYSMDLQYENDPEYRKICDEELSKLDENLNDNMEEYFGNIRLIGSINFEIRAEDREKAQDKLIEDMKNKIKNIEIILKNSDVLEISEEINWELNNTIQEKSILDKDDEE